jgi:hypothetical protein
VVSDKKVSQDPAAVSNPEKRATRPRLDGRQRFYLALLLFVVIVGLPIVTVPSLRQRLETRVGAFRDAFSGRIGPVTVETSEEQAPFPEEYERYAASFPGPGGSLPMDRIFTARGDQADPDVYYPPALISPERSDAGKPAFVPEPEAGMPEPDGAESDSDDELGYARGEVEQEVYDILLETYPQVAEMVKGGDPDLRFLSWGAVKRGDDLYWVRLIFETDKNPKVEYIWRVEPESKQVLPLSHNARSIL